MTETLPCVELFLACCNAWLRNIPIQRVSRSDKEFHFQNWVAKRFDDANLAYVQAGRNTYPDFTLVHHPEGYEVKGLAWPGRQADYDSNSRAPSGLHNMNDVYYIFGRYPANTHSMEYPVRDLVVCHGDFLNADHKYVHENRSFRGFGSYGDLLVRDRKMYVAPTPFALTNGTIDKFTLITPEGVGDDDRLEHVGTLVRTETAQIVTAYTFDLRSNHLTLTRDLNHAAGLEHKFSAYRMRGMEGGTVSMLRTLTVDMEYTYGSDK